MNDNVQITEKKWQYGIRFERVKKEPKPPIRVWAVYQWCTTNTDCRLSDWQVNGVNIVVKCPNRFHIPKRLVSGIKNLLVHITTMLTWSFTCQSASLQSAFVAHRFNKPCIASLSDLVSKSANHLMSQEKQEFHAQQNPCKKTNKY